MSVFFCSFAYFCAWLLSAWCEGGERRSLVGFLSSLELRSKMQVRDGDGACLTRPSLAGCQLCCIMDDLDWEREGRPKSDEVFRFLEIQNRSSS